MSVRKVVNTFFKSRPLIANGVIYGSMWGFAEFSQQVILKKCIDNKKAPDPINKGAIVRCIITGSCVTSSILFFWYKWLDKVAPGSSGKVIVKKLLLDQFVLAPPLLSAIFISLSVLEGKEDVLAECKEKIVPALQKAWLFWFPAQTINFLFIPPAMRIAYISGCSFAWTNIICFIKRSNKHEVHNIPAPQESLTL